jgi:hypothetical protein
MAESKFGFTIGEEVEAQDFSDSAWTRGVIVGFDDDNEPIRVRWTSGPAIGDCWWCRVERVRKRGRAPVPFQWKLDKDGTPFTRQRGDWQSAMLDSNELTISVPPCGHFQRVVLRMPPTRTESDIIAEIRRVAGDSGEAITRGRLTNILNGEF